MKKIFLAGLLSLLFFYGWAQEKPLKALDVNLENYQYPYPVSFLNFHSQLQDLRMAYMEVKPPNYNGKNVMLLHGKNFNGAYWRTTIAALSKAGYRVVVPDQIGFGKSSKPPRYQYTFQQLATNTKRILDTLHIHKITVLGHSMGGMVAARFALMYPKITEKLVLTDPLGLEDWKVKVPYTSIQKTYQNELKVDYQSIKAYQIKNYYHGTWKPEYDEWARLLAGWTLNKDYKTIAWASALTYDMIFTQPVCYEFKKITSPTLLIVGTLDKTAIGKLLVSPEVRETMGNYAELGKTTSDEIPNCTLVEIPGVGHLPQIEAFPKFITPLLQFLK